MATILRDNNLTRLPGTVKPDSRKRVSLPSVLVKEDIIYHVYSNKLGQIILDPQATIPASEAWLFNNPEVLASVKKGLEDITNGRVSRVDLDSL